ncbi:putative glycosyltransferase involved in capsule biosynthesis [Phyllobacterium trifolii]|uniref:Putative glycosyltransferase involved in capsule biosynthesis n=1 Tax=Phyllobacterium trifolii TaxID=300193 RepID=A0A839UGS1_9HYPH|nr:glycosyltransferase [Phyllobacterium trifolii]MBB3149757.1 putative glycosyltransferase involved in capsule biosynthesis [Phyllobacterium trifolii]
MNLNSTNESSYFKDYNFLYENHSITLVIPIRLTQSRLDLLDRLYNYKYDTDLPDNLDLVIVDDGSRPELFKKVEQLGSNQITILRTSAKPHQDFNLARARNYGAQHAKGKFVFFLDADLVPYPGFFKSIQREIALSQMDKHVDRFLMCPVIYLTDMAFDLHEKMPPEFRRQFFISAMLANDTNLIEKFSSGTSAIVIEKKYYLSRGGQDEQFNGWGYEDYEFANRLIRRNRQFPLPSDWLSMAGNFMTIRKYSGWKAIYRLYGDWLSNKGIYLFHTPHPIEKRYHHNKDQNLALLKSRMIDDQGTGNEPPALPDLTINRKTLLFRKNPFCFHRAFAPNLGEHLFSSEDRFHDVNIFLQFLADNNISLVVFPNPYSNEKLLTIYNWCRDNSVPYVVSERGALPDSVFHDPRGFLSDSESYCPHYWNMPLSEDKLERVTQYISSVRFGDNVLEKQALRLDVATIRARLKLGRKKVLFVPFQQPNDTVIKYFCGPIKTFENFHNLVAKLPEELGDEWCVVYKRHPAEDGVAPIEGAICADDYHVYDLLEISDAVALINSGVGVLAMMFGKPVFSLGETWYCHANLCANVSDPTTLAHDIRQGFSLDYDEVLRFIYYLRFGFYSFGKMVQRRVRYPDGSPITATTDIQYYELRYWNDQTTYLPISWKPIGDSSPLFDRYKASAPSSAIATSNSKLPSQKASALIAHAEPQVLTAGGKLDQVSAEINAFTEPAAVRKLRKLRKSPVKFFLDAAKKLFAAKRI